MFRMLLHHCTGFTYGAVCLALGVVVSCGSNEDSPVVGGTSGGGNTGGSSAGASGVASGAAGIANTSGTGSSGAPGAGAGGALGGAAGSPSAGSGGSNATAGAGSGDTYASNVTIAVHPEVNTILEVTWNQTTAAESTWLEFTFDAGEVLKSRAKPGTAGQHRDVVLGAPAQTPVTVRVVSLQAGVEHATRDYQGTTGALPTGLPRPQVLAYDAARASPERWMLAAVEDSEGGCGRTCYNQWTYWTYIMDRKGRIVWYYADPASNATSSYQRVARDGEYIWIEKRPFGGQGTRGVLKMTLDWEYFEEVPVPSLADCIDITTDGSLLYDVTGTTDLREMRRDRTTRNIWNCRTAFGQDFSCYSNTVNWNEATDTILMSFPEENTVAEIHRQTGMLVATYGDRAGGYAFSPATWQFEFQHFPNISADGTLMVSSHMPGFADTYTPVAGEHAFLEFTIDRTNRRLVEKWSYHEGMEWPMFKGMAIRLANGNTLANYGSGGVIREITPDKQTVFHVKFDAPAGNDFYNKMVGHNVYIADLYALNGGGPP